MGMEMHGFRPVPVHIPPPAVVLDGATEGKTVAALQGGEERLAVRVLRAIEDVQVLQRPANFTGAPWPCSLTILSMYKIYYYSPLFKICLVFALLACAPKATVLFKLLSCTTMDSSAEGSSMSQ